MAAAPLRVCHLVSDDVWGGAESVIRGLLEAHAKRADLALSLIALNEGDLVAFAREAGIETRVVPEEGRRFLPLLRDVDRAMTELRPDVIHSHRYKENFLAYLLAGRHRARSVVTLHGDEPPATRSARLKVRVRRSITRWLARRVGAHFATVSRDLPPLLGLSQTEWVLIPNGIALPRAAHPFESAPGAAHRPATIGWVGRLVAVKDVPLLLEALSHLSAAFATTRLLLVGDGPERSFLEAAAARLGIAARVEFRGFVRDPGAERERMDLFALPSQYEGSPLALLEAMGAGLPCIAAAVGGIPEMAGPDDNVRLLTSRRPEDWAAALTELLSRPSEARALGERGRKRVAEHFTVEAVADAYLALYRSRRAVSVGR